jgi:hypothetical protein
MLMRTGSTGAASQVFDLMILRDGARAGGRWTGCSSTRRARRMPARKVHDCSVGPRLTLPVCCDRTALWKGALLRCQPSLCP